MIRLGFKPRLQRPDSCRVQRQNKRPLPFESGFMFRQKQTALKQFVHKICCECFLGGEPMIGRQPVFDRCRVSPCSPH